MNAWQQHAACRGAVALFFATPDSPRRVARAVACCCNCPVALECQHDTLASDRENRIQEILGVRGGLTEGVRRELARGRAA